VPLKKENQCMAQDGMIQLTGLSVLLLVPVLSQALLTLVSRHLMSFSFFSAWHKLNVF
jgi:hypothetical protein